MMRWSRSISVTGTSNSTSTRRGSASASAPLTTTTRAHSSAVPASTSGYRAEMRTPHDRQRPRSASHESTGTLSYGRMGVSHCGHREPGRDSDSPRGSRYATTLRNEPKIAPMTAANDISDLLGDLLDGQPRGDGEPPEVGLVVVRAYHGSRERQTEPLRERLDEPGDRDGGTRHDAALDVLGAL